jgi:glucosamine--fructose-6-phosphate aminotransferase (isomerizing)
VTALEATIRLQPDLLERMMRADLGDLPERIGRARRTWLVGTGTSQHAAELGAMLLRGARQDARPVSSATFVRWSEAPLPGDAVVVLSHTGESAFPQAARERALSAGADPIGITGQGAGWAGAFETVPRERSHTYTASYTAVLVLIGRVALALGFRQLARDFDELPARTREAIADPAIVNFEPPSRLTAVAGAGPFAITAREGALKLREAARVLAEGYESEYLLHGMAVPLNSNDLLLLLQPAADDDGLTADLGTAARAAGLATSTFEEPPGLHPLLTQIPLTARLQLLASRLADERGQDPDTVITGPWAADELWDRGRPR